MLRNRLYLAIVGGHFAIDMLTGSGAVLLAVLATPLALSNSQIGLALTGYTLAGSLSQPLFGWLADRVRLRPALLAAIGVLWMIVCYCGVALAPGWAWLLPCFLLAALGSGLFHPVGTAAAAAAAPERAASATAVFFFGGQMGLALGPVLGGLLFGTIASQGIFPLAAVALAPAAALLLAPRPSAQVRRRTPRAARQKPAGDTAPHARFLVLGSLVAFIALVALRSSIQASYQAFLPKLFADRGWQPEIYGLLAGAFMATAATGNVVTGHVADRFGMRTATVWPLLLSVPAGLVCFMAPSLPAVFIACGLAGFLVGGQHSVLVVHAQRLLPTGQGFAAGLILGFTFATGAIGTWLVGLAADHFSLTAVMEIVTLLGLPATLLALTLPGRKRPAPAVETPASAASAAN